MPNFVDQKIAQSEEYRMAYNGVRAFMIIFLFAIIFSIANIFLNIGIIKILPDRMLGDSGYMVGIPGVFNIDISMITAPSSLLFIWQFMGTGRPTAAQISYYHFEVIATSAIIYLILGAVIGGVYVLFSWRKRKNLSKSLRN